MSEELKPCPFCGHDTPEFVRLGNAGQSCIVECGYCGCRHESSDEGAMSGSSWNTRAQQPAASEPLMDESQTPFQNCRFQVCDLPGQCAGEGRCHHPSVKSWIDAHTASEPSSGELATLADFLKHAAIAASGVNYQKHPFYRAAALLSSDARTAGQAEVSNQLSGNSGGLAAQPAPQAVPQAEAVRVPLEYHCIGFVDGYDTHIKDKSARMKAPRAVYVADHHPQAEAVRVQMTRSERAEWWAVAMNAAAALESAASCLRDPDAKKSALGACEHVRQKCNRMWESAPKPQEPEA